MHLELGADLYLSHSTFLLPVTREFLLSYLPENAVVAEVGVAEGEFSKKILETTRPAHLSLIDLWAHQADPTYTQDENNVSQLQQDERFKSVSAMFAPQTQAGTVSVFRGDSTVIGRDFPDAQFDWIYIDGNHSYSGVIADLEIYSTKLKPNGLILCHDFANHVSAKQMGFDVVGAVFDFCRKSSFQLIAITTVEEFPTCVIAPPSSAEIDMLKFKLLYTLGGITEIKDFLARKYETKIFKFSDNRQNIVVSF